MADHTRDHLVRLLGIVTYLDTHGDTAFAELASHFDAPESQIRADINALWTSGLPGYLHGDLIDFDYDAYQQGVASLVNSQGVTQVRLSTVEMTALVGALTSIAAAGTAPAIVDDVLKALRERLGHDQPVTVLPGQDPVDPLVRRALDDGIDSHRAVLIDYVDSHDRRTERLIEPHRLVAVDGVGYVECWCHRAEDWRTLRIDRISSARLTDTATLHPPSTGTGFELAPRFEATVRMARAGRWALDDVLGATIVDEGDTVLVRVHVADADWLATRLLLVAPHLIEVEPAILRDVLARHAERVLKAASDYTGPTAT